MIPEHIRQWLDEAAALYEQPSFIADDPIQVPRRYTLRQDIEIAAFWTAILAWGQRRSIIQKATALFERMDDAPYAFVSQHSPQERRRFADWKHRTFQMDDTVYFLEKLQAHYQQHDSLEAAFTASLPPAAPHTEAALIGFHRYFFDHPHAPARTRKHVATPERKASCKRLNMFLRWMVRPAAAGVDFGLWQGIRPAQLLVPLDVHVERVARRLGLLQRPQRDWQAVLELSAALRQLDPDDPVKYDFALFGVGVLEKGR